MTMPVRAPHESKADSPMLTSFSPRVTLFSAVQFIKDFSPIDETPPVSVNSSSAGQL